MPKLGAVRAAQEDRIDMMGGGDNSSTCFTYSLGLLALLCWRERDSVWSQAFCPPFLQVSFPEVDDQSWAGGAGRMGQRLENKAYLYPCICHLDTRALRG